MDKVKRDQEGRCEAKHGPAHAEGYFVHPVIINTHQPGRLSILRSSPDRTTQIGLSQIEFQKQNKNEGKDETDHARLSDEESRYLPDFTRVPCLHRPVISSKKEQGNILNDHHEAGGEKDHGKRGGLFFPPQDGLDEEPLEEVAEEKEKTGSDQRRKIRVYFEKNEDPIDEEHSHHEEGSMGEVDNLGDPEYKTETHGYEPIEPTH